MYHPSSSGTHLTHFLSKQENPRKRTLTHYCMPVATVSTRQIRPLQRFLDSAEVDQQCSVLHLQKKSQAITHTVAHTHAHALTHARSPARTQACRWIRRVDQACGSGRWIRHANRSPLLQIEYALRFYFFANRVRSSFTSNFTLSVKETSSFHFCTGKY